MLDPLRCCSDWWSRWKQFPFLHPMEAEERILDDCLDPLPAVPVESSTIEAEFPARTPVAKSC